MSFGNNPAISLAFHKGCIFLSWKLIQDTFSPPPQLIISFFHTPDPTITTYHPPISPFLFQARNYLSATLCGTLSTSRPWGVPKLEDLKTSAFTDSRGDGRKHMGERKDHEHLAHKPWFPFFGFLLMLMPFCMEVSELTTFNKICASATSLRVFESYHIETGRASGYLEPGKYT